MNIKTTLLALNVLLGTLYLGLPILFGVLAFNTIFWIGIVYNFFTSNEEDVVNELLAKTKASVPTAEQVAFERFLIKNFVESNFTENELANPRVRGIEQPVMASIEA